MRTIKIKDFLCFFGPLKVGMEPSIFLLSFGRKERRKHPQQKKVSCTEGQGLCLSPKYLHICDRKAGRKAGSYEKD